MWQCGSNFVFSSTLCCELAPPTIFCAHLPPLSSTISLCRGFLWEIYWYWSIMMRHSIGGQHSMSPCFYWFLPSGLFCSVLPFTIIIKQVLTCCDFCEFVLAYDFHGKMLVLVLFMMTSVAHYKTRLCCDCQHLPVTRHCCRQRSRWWTLKNENRCLWWAKYWHPHKYLRS